MPRPRFPRGLGFTLESHVAKGLELLEQAAGQGYSLAQGNLGIVECIISRGVCGMAYAVLAGQPMTFIGSAACEMWPGATFNVARGGGLGPGGRVRTRSVSKSKNYKKENSRKCAAKLVEKTPDPKEAYEAALEQYRKDKDKYDLAK